MYKYGTDNKELSPSCW